MAWSFFLTALTTGLYQSNEKKPKAFPCAIFSRNSPLGGLNLGSTNVWNLKPADQPGITASLHSGNPGRKEALAQGQGVVEVDSVVLTLPVVLT